MRKAIVLGACLFMTSVLVGCDDDGSGVAVDLPATRSAPQPTFYASKTPYQPQQELSSYEAPPDGYTPVFTELVARHGARGLSSLKYDAAMYAIWQRARADGALTPLGEQLGPDIMQLMRANALLDYNVEGIASPGYGNLTQVGMAEHRELAVRLFQRLPDYFEWIAARASTDAPRRIIFSSSGENRARESGAFLSTRLRVSSRRSAGLWFRRQP